MVEKKKEKVVTWEIKKVKEKYFANIYVNHKYLQSVQLTKSQLYTIEQKDYNFDGQRDICFYPQQESKPIYCCPIKPLYTAISSLNPAEIGMISSYFKFQAPLE